jgi:undecaprenyl-diphosphatase
VVAQELVAPQLVDLHHEPPMTMARVHARHAWLLPTAAVLFVLLAIGAAFNTLPWDKPIFNVVIDARTPWLDELARRVSFFGSTRVVLAAAAIVALLAWQRCPRLAIAIVVIVAVRPLAEWALKELVSRDRPPVGTRLVTGTGYSYPSGHPLATAATWGVVPLVAALYTRQRVVWWTISVATWMLIVLVAASRVMLGVHWPTDVAGSLLLVVIGVAGAERFVELTHAFGPGEEDHALNRCSRFRRVE